MSARGAGAGAFQGDIERERQRQAQKNSAVSAQMGLQMIRLRREELARRSEQDRINSQIQQMQIEKMRSDIERYRKIGVEEDAIRANRQRAVESSLGSAYITSMTQGGYFRNSQVDAFNKENDTQYTHIGIVNPLTGQRYSDGGFHFVRVGNDNDGNRVIVTDNSLAPQFMEMLNKGALGVSYGLSKGNGGGMSLEDRIAIQNNASQNRIAENAAKSQERQYADANEFARYNWQSFMPKNGRIATRQDVDAGLAAGVGQTLPADPQTAFDDAVKFFNTNYANKDPALSNSGRESNPVVVSPFDPLHPSNPTTVAPNVPAPNEHDGGSVASQSGQGELDFGVKEQPSNNAQVTVPSPSERQAESDASAQTAKSNPFAKWSKKSSSNKSGGGKEDRGKKDDDDAEKDESDDNSEVVEEVE